MVTCSQITVIVLMIIAGIVSYRQYKKDKKPDAITWALIVSYWVALTIKNLFDYLHL